MSDDVASRTPQPNAGHTDFEDTPGHPAGDGLIKDFYDDRLANSDLAPLKKQTWSSYNIFAFWMSDVHSVGGYVTAGSLFSLGIASWQVLVSLVVGICIVMVFCNLVAKPSQVTGVPYPGDQPGHLRGRRAPTSRPSSGAASPSPGTACRPTWPPPR